jgi:hypothetical protein
MKRYDWYAVTKQIVGTGVEKCECSELYIPDTVLIVGDGSLILC